VNRHMTFITPRRVLVGIGLICAGLVLVLIFYDGTCGATQFSASVVNAADCAQSPLATAFNANPNAATLIAATLVGIACLSVGRRFGHDAIFKP
jgi:hypothetical protein